MNQARRVLLKFLGFLPALLFGPSLPSLSAEATAARYREKFPETYGGTPLFWDYLRLARPNLCRWLYEAGVREFQLAQSNNRFRLSVAGTSRSCLTGAALHEADRQVCTDDITMVFSGSPAIFEAGHPGLSARNCMWNQGDIFMANPHALCLDWPNRVQPCQITWREGFYVDLTFADGMVLKCKDVDELRTWLV